MGASRDVDFSFHIGIGRQRGWGLGAFAQVFGRTALIFLRNYFVPSSKHGGADLLEFATPQTAEVASGRKNFKSVAKKVGRRTLRKQLGTESIKGVHAESFQQSVKHNATQSNWPRRDIFQTFVVNHGEHFL